MTSFEQQLQGLLASSLHINKSENDLVGEILSVLGGWAAAKQRNSDVLRQRVAALSQQPAHPLPQNGTDPANPHPGASLAGGTRQALDNLRRAGVN